MATKSRFFAGSSSESENESDNESKSSDDAPITQRQAAGRFATFDESDSDSGDERRVAKSQKDRAWDNIKDAIVKIYDALKINDWSKVQDEYKNVNAKVEKSKMLTLVHGLPAFYIKMLVDLEEKVLATKKDKEAEKKMKPAISKAFNQIKSQLKKHNELPEYKEKVEDCRAHPEKYTMAVAEEEEDDEEEEEVEVKKVQKVVAEKSKSKPAKKVDENDDWEENSYKSSEDDESEEEDDTRELKGRAKWLKKAEDTGVSEKRKRRVKTGRVTEKDYEAVKPDRRAVSWNIQDMMTEEELDKKVSELVASRGRKSTDNRVILRQLEVLTKAARIHGPKKEIPVLAHLIAAMFDSNRLIDEYMELQQWRTCQRSLSRILKLIEQNKSLTLGTVSTDLSAGAADVEAAALDKKSNVIKIVGSIDSFILRLEDEYMKSLQQINPHTQEYVTRLSDEASLIELAESILAYDSRVSEFKAAASVALMIMEHTYYKHDTHAVAVQKAHVFNKTWGRYNDLHPASLGRAAPSISKVVWPVNADDAASAKAAEAATVCHPAAYIGNPTVPAPTVDVAKRIEELSCFIFKYGDERLKTRALLCSVYHHALHDRYYNARDLFLISHVHDFIDKADVKTQILYNRTVVTLGLSAFRLGLFQKAHDCLTGICSGRVKELLAQGQGKYGDRDAEQEKIERRRQIPYHMHINPELLECCHLTCAMMLELPQLARSPISSLTTQQHVISKQFRKFLSMYNKQVFTGPPENTKEHVLAATNALLLGEWEKAVTYLTGLDVWNYIPNEGGEAVKKMLEERIKEEAVRTYMLINSEHYDSMNINHLCEMFAMDEQKTRRIISRMIFNKEISAAWDNPAHILLMYKTDPSPLQSLSQAVAEKITQLMESNERILDPLMGVYGFRDDWGGNAGAGGGNRQGGGGERKFKGGANYKPASRPTIAPRKDKVILGKYKVGGKGYSGNNTKPAWNSETGGRDGGSGAGRYNNRNEGGGRYIPPSMDSRR